MTRTLCAAVQMASSPNVSANLIEAGRLVEKAAGQGVSLIVLPENFALMGLAETDKLEIAEADGRGPIQQFLADTAEKFKLWIVGGTIPIRASPGKVRATCLTFNDRGERIGRYDKIHLFDVNVPGTNEQYRESHTIEAGERAMVLDTPFGRLGVTICYDLRFPELYRQLADTGMDILAIPAAFTAQTGAAHWDILVRARALENLCYAIASNQGGFHVNGRKTYGHSMIVDPWGKIMTSLPRGSGIVSAEIDLNHLEKIRAAFPALQHRRLRCG